MVRKIGGIGASASVVKVPFRAELAATMRKLFAVRIDQRDPANLANVRDALAPLYAAGRAAFSKIPLADALKLAQVTHDAYFTRVDEPLIKNPTSIIVDPSRITRENVAQLKALLTPEGPAEADKFVSGTHIGKAFIVPAHIIPGKEAEFLAFFGKTDSQAIASLTTLVGEKNAKKKLVNNQSMTWDTLMARYNTIYVGANSTAMKEFQVGLQVEAILDSAITLALLEEGIIPADQQYSIYHILWSTHNDWEAAAKINYEDLDGPDYNGRDRKGPTQLKDDVILNAHTALRIILSPVIDSVGTI